MFGLDIATLVFGGCILSLASSVAIMLIAHRYPVAQWPYFAASALTYTLGVLITYFLASSGNTEIPVFGSGLIMASFLSAHAGMCRVWGVRPPIMLYAIALIWCAAGSIAPSVGHRVIFLSIPRIILCAHAASMAHRRWRETANTSASILRGMFLGWVVVLAVRTLGAIFIAVDALNYLDYVAAQSFYFSFAGGLHVAAALAVMTMAFEHEEGRLSQRIAEQTHELREAKDTAEEALASKTRFLAAAGHDLRQATHALGLQLNVVAHEIDGYTSKPPLLHGVTSDMRHVIADMRSQLTSMLDLASIDCGLTVPRKECVPISTLFTELERQFHQIAIAEDVDLRFIASSQTVVSDPVMLLRILGNLVANAIKFGRKRRVVVGCRRRSDRIVIQVADEGVGIDRNNFSDIFKEYSQISSDTCTRSKGFGLGLSIASRFCNSLGHNISVSSIFGSGSIFSVEIFN